MMGSMEELLEHSRQLTSQLHHGLLEPGTSLDFLPPIERNIEQIQDISRRLATPSIPDDASLQAKGHQFLAQCGVDSAKMTKSLSQLEVAVPSTYESPVSTQMYSDVESHIRQTRENLIQRAIESTLTRAQQEFHDKLDKNAKDTWTNVKQSLIRDMSSRTSQFTANVPTATATTTDASTLSDETIAAYAPAIQQLLEAHLAHENFPILTALETVTAKLHPNDHTSLLDCFRILKYLMKENPDTVLPPFLAYKDAYQQQSTHLHEQFVNQSRQYLESQFLQFVEKSVLQHPREAQLGGRPTIDDKIRAFLNIKYYRASAGGWIIPSQTGTSFSLDIIADRPFWAHLYYLIRCGAYEESFQYARSNEPFLDHGDKKIVAYLKAYTEADDKRLSRPMRSHFLAEYNQRVKTSKDPYKLAVYKIIGRCELHKKTVPYVLHATEDYVWLQLVLTRERYAADETDYEKYTLMDLQKLLVSFGADHFNQKRRHPFNYIHVLLLSAQFERAIEFMYQHHFPAESVHLCIALLHYGALRVCATSNHLLEEQDGKPLLAAEKLLYQYTLMVMASDAFMAIHYVYFTFLVLPGIDQSLLVKVILHSRDYHSLFGELQSDGTKSIGWIERYSTLNPSTAVHPLMDACAKACKESDRPDDAMQLYNLLGNYDAVLMILHSRVSERMAMRSDRMAFQQSKTLLETIYHYYATRPLLREKINQHLWQTTQQLEQLCRLMNSFDESDYESVISLVNEMNWMPNDQSSMETLQNSVDAFNRVDDVIKRHMSELLDMTMTSIYKLVCQLKESVYVDAARMTKLQALKRRGRTLMTFIGMISFSMSQDLYAKMTRMDVYMN